MGPHSMDPAQDETDKRGGGDGPHSELEITDKKAWQLALSPPGLTQKVLRLFPLAVWWVEGWFMILLGTVGTVRCVHSGGRPGGQN